MDWPETFATKQEVNRLEDQGYNVVPYVVQDRRSQPAVFAAMVHSEDNDTVSGWYYHPQREEWVEEGRTEPTKVIPQKHGVFEGGINVFGEPGKEAEKIRNSIADTLTHYLDDFPFIYNEESAQALQPTTNVGECNCSSENTEQFEMSKIPVHNGDDVPVIGCSECRRPYHIGTTSDNISIEEALNIGWAFSDNSPEPDASSGDCTFHHVNASTGKSIHLVVAALVGEVNSEIQFAQDYNAETDEFFLICAEGRIVGFQSWHTEWSKPSLTQLYVRPESRGKNYAKTAIRTWCDYISDNSAFAEHMNEASRPIFRKLGLLEDGEAEFTVKEFMGIDAQKRKMDKKFYEAYPSEVFPK